MKKLGLLYGCELLLDTDDQQKADIAEKWLEQLTWKAQQLDTIKTKEEADNFLKHEPKH